MVIKNQFRSVNIKKHSPKSNTKKTSTFLFNNLDPPKYILIKHLSIWECITGYLEETYISDSSCRILFRDGINIYVPLLDNKTLQRLKNSQDKLIRVCRTDNSKRRYLFDFNIEPILKKDYTSLDFLNNEEINAIKVLKGWSAGCKLRKKQYRHIHKNQQQLNLLTGGL